MRSAIRSSSAFPQLRPIGLSVATGVYRPTELASPKDSSNKRLLMQVRNASRAGHPACSYRLQRRRVSRHREADINVQAKHEAWTGTRLFAWKQGRAGAGVRTHASPESTASGEAGPAHKRTLEAAAGRHFPADHLKSSHP